MARYSTAAAGQPEARKVQPRLVNPIPLPTPTFTIFSTEFLNPFSYIKPPVHNPFKSFEGPFPRRNPLFPTHPTTPPPVKKILNSMEDVERRINRAVEAALERQAARFTELLVINNKRAGGAEADSLQREEIEKSFEPALAALNEQRRLVYAENGFTAPEDYSSVNQGRGFIQDRQPFYERAEHIDAEHIGFLNPAPTTGKWDGKITDDSNDYLSFMVWLDHLKMILDQKDSLAWKHAVLDTASLQCMKGYALAWYSALMPDQQTALRRSIDLSEWWKLGRVMVKNSPYARQAALNRKREFGETMLIYGWRKLAMLNEAYGRDRAVVDTISDIKEGLSLNDQVMIRTDLSANPSVQALFEEFTSFDLIRSPMFAKATCTEDGYGNSRNQGCF